MSSKIVKTILVSMENVHMINLMTINVPVTKDGLEKIVTFAHKDLLEKIVKLLKVVLLILVIMEYVHLINLMNICAFVKKVGPEKIVTIAQGWFGRNCDFNCASNPNGRISNGVCYIFMKEQKNHDDAYQSCNSQG